MRDSVTGRAQSLLEQLHYVARRRHSKQRALRAGFRAGAVERRQGDPAYDGLAKLRFQATHLALDDGRKHLVLGGRHLENVMHNAEATKRERDLAAIDAGGLED